MIYVLTPSKHMWHISKGGSKQKALCGRRWNSAAVGVINTNDLVCSSCSRIMGKNP